MDTGAIVGTLAAYAVLILLGIWLLYTIIWRAVRRGLREYKAGPVKNRPRGMFEI